MTKNNMNTFNFQLKNRLNEVFFIPPNDLGLKPLNYFYKRLTGPMKKAPFIYIIPLSFLVVLFFYFIFGLITIKLTTILQYGF